MSAPFGPPQRPRPAGDPDRVRKRAVGADGLQAGHRYTVGVSEGQSSCWWRYGTREEVLASPESQEWQLGESEPAMGFERSAAPHVEFEITE